MYLYLLVKSGSTSLLLQTKPSRRFNRHPGCLIDKPMDVPKQVPIPRLTQISIDVHKCYIQLRPKIDAARINPDSEFQGRYQVQASCWAMNTFWGMVS
jgi:hypothetical protein